MFDWKVLFIVCYLFNNYYYRGKIWVENLKFNQVQFN